MNTMGPAQWAAGGGCKVTCQQDFVTVVTALGTWPVAPEQGECPLFRIHPVQCWIQRRVIISELWCPHLHPYNDSSSARLRCITSRAGYRQVSELPGASGTATLHSPKSSTFHRVEATSSICDRRGGIQSCLEVFDLVSNAFHGSCQTDSATKECKCIIYP